MNVYNTDILMKLYLYILLLLIMLSILIHFVLVILLIDYSYYIYVRIMYLNQIFLTTIKLIIIEKRYISLFMRNSPLVVYLFSILAPNYIHFYRLPFLSWIDGIIVQNANICLLNSISADRKKWHNLSIKLG